MCIIQLGISIIFVCGCFDYYVMRKTDAILIIIIKTVSLNRRCKLSRYIYTHHLCKLQRTHQHNSNCLHFRALFQSMRPSYTCSKLMRTSLWWMRSKVFLYFRNSSQSAHAYRTATQSQKTRIRNHLSTFAIGCINIVAALTWWILIRVRATIATATICTHCNVCTHILSERAEVSHRQSAVRRSPRL